MLYRITQWGEGESTSIMQSPAAYTLPVKLLTSTNDFLMIGPTIPRSCLLTNNHTNKHTHTCYTLHTFCPTHNHRSFTKGNTCGLMDHCDCHSLSGYFIKTSNKMLPFPRDLYYLGRGKKIACTPLMYEWLNDNAP